jgi:hypothetical protein
LWFLNVLLGLLQKDGLSWQNCSEVVFSSDAFQSNAIPMPSRQENSTPGLPGLLQHTKTGENIPNNQKIYQMSLKYTKWPYNIPYGRKIFQMATKHTNIFHFKTLQNLPKFGFFGLKIYHLATLLDPHRNRHLNSILVHVPRYCTYIHYKCSEVINQCIFLAILAISCHSLYMFSVINGV